MSNRIKASIAAGAIALSGMIGVPVVQATTGLGAGVAEARPDPGQGYTRCAIIYMYQGLKLHAYRVCQ